MPLCGHCSAAQWQTHADSARNGGSQWFTLYTHMPAQNQRLLSLQQSAELECFFCKQFWESLTPQHMAVMLGSDFAGIIVAVYWDQKSANYTMLQFILGPEFDECYEVVTDKFELLHTRRDIQIENRSASTPNATCFHDVIPKWVSNCAKQHINSCGAVYSSSWLPSRLIDVGNLETECPPRVVLTHGLRPSDCRYVAMSYLPSSDEFAGLCTSNVERFQTCLPWQELPMLFRYAILVTRALACQYIWVDTLCVLQDDPNDLLRELPLIGKVYQHCAVNVTAASANCLARVWRRRCNIDLMAPYPIQPSYRHTNPPCLISYEAVPENVWSTEVVASRLACYGGYFQDQVLASRRLHFGRNQVYWECTRLQACETFPDGLPVQILNNPINETPIRKLLRQVQLQSKTKLPKTCPQINQHTTGQWSGVWNYLVDEYTQCYLSDPQMKLVGISGIARELEAGGKQKYLAGLWQRSLLNDLLWYVDGTPSRRPNKYCAPSWSWASVEGAVKHLPASELFSNCVKVIRAHITPVDPSFTTGQIAGGFLWLHGYLIAIPKPEFYCVRGRLSAGCFYPDDRKDITDDYYFCLPVRRQRSPQGDFLCGLVLRQIITPWAVMYQRVGMFRCLRGDSLHILGQKKFGKDAYVFPEHPEERINSTPLETDIMII